METDETTMMSFPSLIVTNCILTVGGVVLPFCPEIISFCVVRFCMGLVYPTFYFNIYLLGKRVHILFHMSIFGNPYIQTNSILKDTA